MKDGISIIIVSYNVENSLRHCLQSFISQVNWERDEIIVIDNNSQDLSVQLVEQEFGNIKLIKNFENIGYARACNQGYRASKNQILIFANGDVFISRFFISRALRKMNEKTNCGILGPELKNAEDRIIQPSWVRDLTFFGELIVSFFSPSRIMKYDYIRRLVVKSQQIEKNVPIIMGACMVIRRRILDLISGMDENFELYFEDADICYRCRKAGWDVCFSPDLVVYHELGKSSKLIPRKIQLIYRQSQIYYYNKHNSFLELQILKIYLFIKFVIWRSIWRDKIFFRYFYTILLERKHYSLSDISEVDV